jgi:hypothetical protein
MKPVLSIQRAALAIWALVAGAIALVGLVLPNAVAHPLYGRALPSLALLAELRADGARLGLALVALVAASQPKPARVLVWAVFAGLAAGTLAVLFAQAVTYAPAPEVAMFRKVNVLDGLAALVLLGTQIARRARS